MATNVGRYEKDLKRLLKEAEEMEGGLLFRQLDRDKKEGKKGSKRLTKQMAELKKKLDGSFESGYQRWYTEATAALAQLIPERLAEFRSLYEIDPKRKAFDIHTYRIQDWLLGTGAGENYLGKLVFDDLLCVRMGFNLQKAIVDAASTRLTSALFDLRGIVQADLFDSELEAAGQLQKSGYLRAAGVVAGVVLEGHLKQVCHDRKVKLSKRPRPTIATYNDGLKKATVYDVPTWRKIQGLADIRNLCGHKGDREPKKTEIGDLIEGVGKITKNVF